MKPGTRISDGTAIISEVANNDLQRRRQLAGEIAITLGKEHHDWTWDRIASEARRRAGLGPLQPRAREYTPSKEAP